MTLEFILCVLIIIIIIGFFVDVNINLKEKIERIPSNRIVIERMKEEYLVGYENRKSKGTDTST